MAGRLLNEVTLTNSHDDNSTHLMDGLNERYEMNKTRGSNLRSPGIVYTGIEAFDRICGGFEPGQLIVGGGKTGMGKTVFGQQVGEFESEQGNHTRMHSLEMPREQLLDRAMARRAEVPYFRVRFGKLSPTDEGKVKALSVIPFFIDDRSGLSVDEIVTATQKAHRTNPITLLIVDHIHIVRKRYPNKEVSELGYIADTLKVLARNLNIVVLLLAQLNRASQGKPVLGDLKYSGDIENAADTVLFFHRENYGTSDTQDTRAEIIIAKGRNMELGSIPVSFNGGYQKFANPDKVWK
jgi:replicative DNA helicase